MKTRAIFRKMSAQLGLTARILLAGTTAIRCVSVLALLKKLAANPLLQLNKNGVEVLLPIFDGLVQKVQRKKKELYVKAPEGLIDLYLG